LIIFASYHILLKINHSVPFSYISYNFG